MPLTACTPRTPRRRLSVRVDPDTIDATVAELRTLVRAVWPAHDGTPAIELDHNATRRIVRAHPGDHIVATLADDGTWSLARYTDTEYRTRFRPLTDTDTDLS